MSILTALPLVVLGYFVGAIPVGVLVARARGVNIQSVGSGNIGATNVLRSVGVVPAIIVAIMDPVKGAAMSLLAISVGLNPWAVAAVALATVLGNNFNVFLRMRGGKGIATSLGAFAVINPAAAFTGLFIALITMWLGRYVSLGSLVGILSVPIILVMFGNFAWPELALTSAFAALAFYRHRENVQRLAAGTERRIGEKRE